MIASLRSSWQALWPVLVVSSVIVPRDLLVGMEPFHGRGPLLALLHLQCWSVFAVVIGLTFIHETGR